MKSQAEKQAPPKRVRTVVVDDSLQFREAVKYILRNMPEIELVGMADNGKSSLKMVRRLQPDLVLMDIRMPVMDGLTATKLIREEHPAVHIVVMSVDDVISSQERALEHGAHRFIPKLYLHRELPKTIKKLIRSLGKDGHKPPPPKKTSNS